MRNIMKWFSSIQKKDQKHTLSKYKEPESKVYGTSIKTTLDDENKSDDEDEEYLQAWFNLNQKDETVVRLEQMMIVKEDSDKVPIHPDIIIKKYEDAIAAYYDLKKYCYQKGKYGRKYFNEMWQHCHNARNLDFDFIDSLKERMENYKNNYQNHLESYNNTLEKLQAIKNPLEDKIKRHYDPDAWYVRIDDRINIYANETNTYVSSAGQKCVEFEEALLEYADNYKNSICPYCKEKVEMPKRKKSCPKCKNKIYIVKGGIKQGNMALKEDDKIKLYELRDDFRTDKHYNPNYGSGIIVDDARIIANEEK